MESTGVYWKPVWHVMEEGFELILANAEHAMNVPGRKTDVKDAEWLAELLAHGLVRGSFVPLEPIQQRWQLRELTRVRKRFVRERVRNVQRLQKTLEYAKGNLDSFVSDDVAEEARARVRWSRPSATARRIRRCSPSSPTRASKRNPTSCARRSTAE